MSRRFLRRRITGVALVLALAVVSGWSVRRASESLVLSPLTTGWATLGVVFFLASYHWRKRFALLPAIGSSAFWMQLHIYVGLFSFAAFFLHTGFQLPNGMLEQMLAVLYMAVAGSGVLGLYLTRKIPKQLANLPREVIFERIPAQRRQVAQRSRELAMQEELGATTIPEFYVEHLHAYFELPRSWAYRIWPNSRRQRRIIAGIRDLQRYCSDVEQRVAWQLADLVRHKDDLDFHDAQQWKLKTWLFWHIGLTYSLLMVAVTHGAIAMAYSGA